MTIHCRISKIDIDRFQVDLTCKSSDLMDKDNQWRYVCIMKPVKSKLLGTNFCVRNRQVFWLYRLNKDFLNLNFIFIIYFIQDSILLYPHS